MNLLGIDEANNIARVNFSQRNCLFERQDLYLGVALSAMPNGSILAVYVKRVGLVAFGGYQNFLGVRHFLIYNRP
jgi:hypothetical protein